MIHTKHDQRINNINNSIPMSQNLQGKGEHKKDNYFETVISHTRGQYLFVYK